MKYTLQETSAPTVMPHFISLSFLNCQKLSFWQAPCKQLFNCIRESPYTLESYNQIKLCLFIRPQSIYRRFWKFANKAMEFLVGSFEYLGFSLDLAVAFICARVPQEFCHQEWLKRHILSAHTPSPASST